ncbi:MAG: hypothetical protein Q4A83_09340 [Bacillota bacterium]|nr:hypothetical protein [Bacillota bacterium]
MDINDMEFEKDQFSLESILEEFGVKPDSPPPEPTEEAPVDEELPGEVSHALEVGDDDDDVRIYTGRIEPSSPREEEAELTEEKSETEEAVAEEEVTEEDTPDSSDYMDEVDRIIAEIRAESGASPAAEETPEEAPAETEAAENDFAEDEEAEEPVPRKKRSRVNVFAGHSKTEDDEPVIQPDLQTEEESIPDSGEYAQGDTDYSQLTEEVIPDSELVKSQKAKLRSFKELVGTTALSLLSLVGLKIGQATHFFAASPTQEEDDLGEELSPAKAAKFYEKRLGSLNTRTKLALLITAVMMYISFGLPVFGALNSLAVSSAVCLILLLTVMILGLDVITSGLTAIGKKRLNANSLVALSCIFSVIDGFIIACGVKAPGIPFCAVSALTLSFTMLGSVLNCRSNKLVLRVAASSRRMYTLSAESDVSDGSITLLKSNRGTKGFVRRTEEAGPDESSFSAMAPIIIPAALLLSFIATVISGSWGSIMHTVSGIFVFAAPAAILFSFALPFFISALSLAPHGACIAGWSGLYDMGKSKDIIITDRDLFSTENVSVKEPRILSGADPREVISMAGSIMAASGCAMSHAFDDLMEKGNADLLEVDDFKCHESGGLVALINGKEVLCGSSGFMQLMNVRLSDRVISKNCVYLAVNRILCGIFEMSYTADKDVRVSLQKLLASNRHPIFAIRDFNLTPTMLSRKFDTPTDGFDFPAFPKRYAISSANPSEESKPAAVLSREGLEPYVDLSDHGKRLYTLVNISIILSVLSSVIGMILMFIFFACSSYGVASASTVLIYMIIWLLPVIIMSLTFRTE